MIDEKYTLSAVNMKTARVHNEHDSVLFLAQDKAVPAMLDAYLEECEALDSPKEHLDGVRRLIRRINKFQRENGCKIPD